MTQVEDLVQTVKEMVLASLPGLITQEDLKRFEQRLFEIEALLDELEEAAGKTPPAEDD
jgi:hypothetical protein